MNKCITYIVFLILIINFSCSSNKNFKKRIQEQTIRIDDEIGTISIRINKKVENIYNPEIINDNYIYIYTQGLPLGIPFKSYRYTLVNNRDTMSIDLPNMYYRTNYFFDNIKFKKGKFDLKLNREKMRNDEIYTKQGKEIFKNEETLLNTTVIYNPYGDFKGKTVKLKDLEFEYYDYKQKDFTLIKED